ncbi:MAG: hypothetical protein AAF623_03780 [Planctomycetota bacterium]
MQKNEFENLKCSEFEDRIHGILDRRGSLSDDLQLHEHASQCESCESLLDAYGAIELFSEESRLNQSTRDQINHQHSQPILKRFTWGVSVTAAAVLLMCGLQFLSPAPSSKRLSQLGINHGLAELDGSPELDLAEPLAATQPEGQPERRATRSTSPFSREFNLANQLPRIPSWQQITDPLNHIEPVVYYSTELPGVRQISGPVNVTIEVIRQSLFQPETDEKIDGKTNPPVSDQQSFRSVENGRAIA